MARSVVPFKRWHYDWLGPAAEGAAPVRVPEDMLAAMEAAYSRTMIVDGEIVCCVGSVTPWPGRHCVWAYMSPKSAAHLLWITRESLKLAATLEGRLELTVRADFAAGHRWAKLLGFEVEAPMLRDYGPAGEDHVGYVRMN